MPSFFDNLFGNASADPIGYGGPQNAYAESMNAGGALSQFNDLFSDQNFIRGLGEAGAAVSRGGSAGEVLGDFAGNLTRRRQFQKAAQGTRQEGKTFQSQLLDALRSGGLLSGKDQNDAFDNFTIDGDGNVSLSMKNTPQKLGFGKNQPLETQRRPASGGSDLPDFSNQSSGGDIDFAGLDPEDIGVLLKAEQQFGALSQGDAQMILQEKARREKIVNDNKIRQQDLAMAAAAARQARLDKQAEADAKVTAAETLQDRQDERERLKDNLKELVPGSLEYQKAELELEKLKKETAEIGKASVQDTNTLAEIERKEIELGMKLDDLEKEELFSVSPVFVDAKGKEIEVPYEEREANAQQINNRQNNKVFYLTKPPVVTGWFDGKSDQDGIVAPIFLPKHPKTSKQITSQDVLDTARANKISSEEVLRQWGLVK